MMDYTAGSIDAEPISVCLTQPIGLRSVCTAGIQRYAGTHTQKKHNKSQSSPQVGAQASGGSQDAHVWTFSACF